MSRIFWYPIAVFLLALAVYCAWLVVAGLWRRRLEAGAAAIGLACLGILYVLWPLLVPPDAAPPDADGFSIRYDVRTRTTWIPPALLVLGLLAATSALAFAAVKFYRERSWSELVAVTLSLALVGMGWFAAVTIFQGTWEIVQAAERGDYEVVEGSVTDYEVTGPDGKRVESFRVDGVPFRYSESSVTAGFDQTAPRGGPIRPGLHVRLAHRGGVILRVETRDDAR